MCFRQFAPIAVALAALVGAAAAQQQVRTSVGVHRPESLPAWLVLELAGDHDDAYRHRKSPARADLEKQLRTLRFDFFRARRNVELRQVGLSQLREHLTAENHPIIADVFGRESDVMEAHFDTLAASESPDADAVLAWAAMRGEREEHRQSAANRLAARTAEAGEAADSAVYVIAYELLRQDERYVGRAAMLADNLNIVQVIPHLINAQLSGGGAARGGSGQRQGDKGWILIGRQVAFVSDLTPVVADSAVAFDPTLSVLTEGALLRVQDGVVVTYRTDVHNALMRLGSRATGQDLGRLDFGWDQGKWWRWYREDVLPLLAERAGAERAEEADDEPADRPSAGAGG